MFFRLFFWGRFFFSCVWIGVVVDVQSAHTKHTKCQLGVDCRLILVFDFFANEQVDLGAVQSGRERV